MRIGIVAPPWFTVPPNGYGGIERVVSYLADGLVDRGHDVTLFASAGSHTKARLFETFDHAPSALLGDPIVESQHLVQAYRHAQEFDVIHDHSTLGLIGAAASPVPVVYTMHGPISPGFDALYRRAHEAGTHLVAISENQRSMLPAGVDATVIHNALDLRAYPFEPNPDGYLLFVGRMNPDKGVLEAIEIARQTGRELVVCAKINEMNEQEYFELVVKPALRRVRHRLVQQVSPGELARYYAGAFASLFPIRWPEPFGLVMIESMATGTPVIAFNNGSVPEVVEDGVTGRICADVEEAVRAVGSIHEISRARCRERVRASFSAPVAVVKHEALYARLLGQLEAPAQGMVRPGPGEARQAPSAS